jgi:hypothetical protein
MIQISAGTSTPILVSTADAATTVELIRVSDAKYWSGAAWVSVLTALPTLSFITGVRQYVTPELTSGHYYLIFRSLGSIIQQEQMYVGGYLYNSLPDTCIVHGTIMDATGEPLQNSNVYFKPVVTTQIINGVAMALTAVITRTDVNGEFALEVVRGAQVLVLIEATSYRKQITIPDQASADIKDL